MARASSARVGRLERKLEDMSKGHRTKVVVQSYGNPEVYVAPSSHVWSKFRYFPVPVTKAVPPQDPKVPPYLSDLYRRQRKVELTGVVVEMEISYVCGMDISAVLYEATARAPLEVEHGVDGLPTSFLAGVKTSGETEPALRMLTLEETGFVDGREGPYEVLSRQEPSPDGKGCTVMYTLNSVDGSMFECPTAKGAAGGALGKVSWSVGSRGEEGYEKHKDCKTVNISLPPPPTPLAVGNNAGFVFPTKRIKMYWEIEQALEFVSEGSTQLARKKDLQVMMMMRPRSVAKVTDEGRYMTVGTVENMSVSVYYRS